MEVTKKIQLIISKIMPTKQKTQAAWQKTNSQMLLFVTEIFIISDNSGQQITDNSWGLALAPSHMS